MSSKTANLSYYKKLVSSIRIDHDGYVLAKDELVRAYESVGNSPTPIYYHLVGETRTGKSCVVQDFLSQHIPIRRAGGIKQAVVYAVMPPKATPKALLEQLLKGLGDPHWDRGTEVRMTRRLLDMLDGVGCRMIILDEFQHICDKGQKLQLHHTADFLKNLLPDNSRALVAVGMPHSATVINSNRQLWGRFGPTIQMPLFNWREKNSRDQFRGILNSFVEQLVPFELPPLGTNEMALRVFLATSGRIGLVVKLIGRAVEDAIEQGTTKIRIEDLSAAFARSIWYAPRFPLKDGPFLADLTDCRPERIEQLVVEAASDDDYADMTGNVSIASSEDATSIQKSARSRASRRQATGASLGGIL